MGTHEYHQASRGRLITEGLTFDAEKHEYYYNGKSLSGVTGLISKKQKKNFATGHVEEGRSQGSHVHAAIEEYITLGTVSSVHPDARWAIEEIKGFEQDGYKIFSEVLVSDFNKYASAIDIFAIDHDAIYLFDTKAGNFDRAYVTWQLSIYKYFLETQTKYRVDRLFCMSTKHHDFYPIIPKGTDEVEGLLYGRTL